MTLPEAPLRDDEWPDEEDEDGEDRESDDDEVPCPSCGEAIFDDAPRCPYCGAWVEAISPAERRARTWRWPILVALLIAVILVLWHGLGR